MFPRHQIHFTPKDIVIEIYRVSNCFFSFLRGIRESAEKCFVSNHQKKDHVPNPARPSFQNEDRTVEKSRKKRVNDRSQTQAAPAEHTP